MLRQGRSIRYVSDTPCKLVIILYNKFSNQVLKSQFLLSPWVNFVYFLDAREHLELIQVLRFRQVMRSAFMNYTKRFCQGF